MSLRVSSVSPLQHGWVRCACNWQVKVRFYLKDSGIDQRNSTVVMQVF